MIQVYLYVTQGYVNRHKKWILLKLNASCELGKSLELLTESAIMVCCRKVWASKRSTISEITLKEYSMLSHLRFNIRRNYRFLYLSKSLSLDL